MTSHVRTRAWRRAALAHATVLTQTLVQVGRATPVLAACASFVFLALGGGGGNSSFLAADVFAALNVFLSLRLALIVLPESLAYVGAAQASRRDRRVRRACAWGRGGAVHVGRRSRNTRVR